jgi:stringent starvation protein B
MNSSKPYLVRALYEWILDNDTTPYILVDTSSDEVLVPPGIANDGKVVLNLAPAAIENLEMTNEHVSFSARFNGVAENIYCPITSLLAIYALRVSMVSPKIFTARSHLCWQSMLVKMVRA